MSTSAATLIAAALRDIGVLAEGEPMSAAMGADGLIRLNQMVQSWQAEFGTVTAVERTIFPLVSNQQTYTIGPGGDFNVPRPVSIDGAGLWLNGLSSANSCTITRSGYVATVTQVSHPFSVGDEAYIHGATQTAYNGLQTVQSVPTADTYTFTVQGTPATPATGTITAAAVEGVPVEIPRPVITDSAFQFLQLKNMSNAQFTVVYYNPTYPFGTIYLWPRPDTAINQLALYLKNVFGGFADLFTTYDYPDLPGYAEALQYQLELRLTRPYGKPTDPELHKQAAQAFGIIKRANNKLMDLPNEAALLTDTNRRGGYNINSGTGG